MEPEQLRGSVNASGPPGSAAKRVQGSRLSSGTGAKIRRLAMVDALLRYRRGGHRRHRRRGDQGKDVLGPLTRRFLGSGETFLCKAV